MCSSDFRVMKRILKLRLVNEDIAVLLAFLVCTPYRDGLKFPKEVEKIQDKLLPVSTIQVRCCVLIEYSFDFSFKFGQSEMFD